MNVEKFYETLATLFANENDVNVTITVHKKEAPRASR